LTSYLWYFVVEYCNRKPLTNIALNTIDQFQHCSLIVSKVNTFKCIDWNWIDPTKEKSFINFTDYWYDGESHLVLTKLKQNLAMNYLKILIKNQCVIKWIIKCYRNCRPCFTILPINCFPHHFPFATLPCLDAHPIITNKIYNKI
jgi:hypothetical protein